MFLGLTLLNQGVEREQQSSQMKPEVLSELKLIKVDESIWSQLLEEEATDTLREMKR